MLTIQRLPEQLEGLAGQVILPALESGQCFGANLLDLLLRERRMEDDVREELEPGIERLGEEPGRDAEAVSTREAAEGARDPLDLGGDLCGASLLGSALEHLGQE